MRFILNRSAPRTGDSQPKYLRVAAERRERNRAAKLCINENKRGTHGLATHGILCRACRATHRGVTIEQVDRVTDGPQH